MFYLFKNTSKLLDEWENLKVRKYSLREYYIFKKWNEIYDGLMPNEDEEKALIGLGWYTRPIHMKETEGLTRDQELEEI